MTVLKELALICEFFEAPSLNATIIVPNLSSNSLYSKYRTSLPSEYMINVFDMSEKALTSPARMPDRNALSAGCEVEAGVLPLQLCMFPPSTRFGPLANTCPDDSTVCKTWGAHCLGDGNKQLAEKNGYEAPHTVRAISILLTRSGVQMSVNTDVLRSDAAAPSNPQFAVMTMSHGATDSVRRH